MQGENSEIKFGTDGWRAVIGDNYNFKNLRILAQATADYIGKGKKIVIGFDTRFMSDKFAQVVAEVLSNNAIKTVLSDRPVPTPALSLAVKQMKADLGIMITASHNPAEYNGFKIKMPSGGAAPIEVTKAIENLLDENTPAENSEKAVPVEKMETMCMTSPCKSAMADSAQLKIFPSPSPM